MMWNPFRKKPRPGWQTGPVPLIFKSNVGLFEYMCIYGKNDIQPRAALCALVFDPPGKALEEMVKAATRQTPDGTILTNYYAMSAYRSWRIKDEENKFTTHLVLLPSEDGGYEALGLCFNKTVRFDVNELVYWVPREQLFPAMGTMTRGLWIGELVAKLAPEIDESGKVRVVQNILGG